MSAISTIFNNKTATSSCPLDTNFMGAWGAKIVRFYNHQCYFRVKVFFRNGQGLGGSHISTILVRVVVLDWGVHQLLFLKQSKFSGCMSSTEWITEQFMHEQVDLESKIQVLHRIPRLARSDCIDACGRHIRSPQVGNLMSSINRPFQLVHFVFPFQTTWCPHGNFPFVFSLVMRKFARA